MKQFLHTIYRYGACLIFVGLFAMVGCAVVAGPGQDGLPGRVRSCVPNDGSCVDPVKTAKELICPHRHEICIEAEARRFDKGAKPPPSVVK